ncbi:hypothetical protein ALC57_15873 [Trachymyrmex cornetzi]|uniref:Histone-lysine N-methyltransferase SETMAR n=1 Tax=Trachymyrmex cornetzi TaxID=471704 RepID=A0A151IW06_9HYME|nr:hypothetical protein ALC57_15873 [Trachymyrmex cornetzi]
MKLGSTTLLLKRKNNQNSGLRRVNDRKKKKVLFHQDNAPSHTSAVAMIRGVIPRCGRKQSHFVHYLAEFMFKKAFDTHGEMNRRFLFNIVAKEYPISDKY